MKKQVFSRSLPKLVLLLGISVLLFATGCDEERPNLDDPIAVADFLCQKSNEVKRLSEKEDAEAAMELLLEIQAFEQEVRSHHGEGFGKFNSEMEREMNARCLLETPQ